jgi:transposase
VPLLAVTGGCLEHGGVASRYRPVDRDQVFLLPPDMREWLPAEHPVWLVLQVVGELDLSRLHARRRLGGVGRAGYDPAMLTALLLYAYCVGQRSSRQIERLCQVDVAFRVVCAQDAPDHTVIARFRQQHDQDLAELFTQVLLVCARAGLGRLGLVAVDGTKIAGNASVRKNRSEAWLRDEAARMLREAAEVDAAEDALFGDARGDELPPELADPAGRAARIRQIVADLDTERATAAQSDSGAEQGTKAEIRAVAEAQTRVAHWQARYAEQVRRARAQQAEMLRRKTEAIGQGIAYPRRDPKPVEQYRRVRLAAARLDHVTNELNDILTARQVRTIERAARIAEADAQRAAQTRRNVTDPDSRIMPSATGGWIQGFNGQVAVTDDQLILAADVVNTPADAGQYQPMIEAAAQAAASIETARGEPAAGIGTVVADAGYHSIANLTAPGPARLIASGKHRSLRRAAAENPASGPPPAGASPREQMDHRLRTPEGQALYGRRAVTVEPVFGQLKETRGFRRFSRRGLQAVQAEWKLMATAHNLMKLHQAQLAT